MLTLEYVVGVDPGAGGHQRTLSLARTVEELTVEISEPLRRSIHHQITLQPCENIGTLAETLRSRTPAACVCRTWSHVLRAAGQDAVFL